MTSEARTGNPYRSAHYVISAHHLSQLPPDEGCEVAFAGRSNAGKSSAINTLTEQKALARTSKTPGRTQQIVVFELDAERRLMDLPGYGYAKVPEKLRAHWQEVMQRYFETRKSLQGVVLVTDIRHPMKPFDEQMLAWCAATGVPCHVLLTKADKLKRGPAQAALLKVRKALPEGATAQVFSAKTRDGINRLIEQLNRWYRFPGPDRIRSEQKKDS
ncbi:MAG: ribosome biogenesis GTP-binding protein YihA/YsxC [Xanthomonadales bacterium]|jgi:GTP-binding protein|nr:ribosome biogenesis GTP-binding protein YihA/YsxC [Xanthomonadales bacterium]